MRPLYQLYHEVRAELDVLQGSIEKKYGLIPLFTEEALTAASASVTALEVEKVLSLRGAGSIGRKSGMEKFSPAGTLSSSLQVSPCDRSPSLGVSSTLSADPFSSFLLKSGSSTPCTFNDTITERFESTVLYKFSIAGHYRHSGQNHPKKYFIVLVLHIYSLLSVNHSNRKCTRAIYENFI